ncbi:TPR-like protein [Cenococcum geophilum 1.58]|uniref:TPR-like protein n=1 Tax=Cenococcum geophilum 1.58 TaxID=794803 RepID=A0ACC8EMF4_9PEZI|nr:TPR-like protein [Cenococcum geophilum 1.58]
MSFGFSVGDIITLTQLTTRTYDGWKNACGKYGDITSNLAVLQTLLMRIEAEAQAPNSLICRNTEDFGGWKTLYESCHTLVVELEEVLDKHKSLGTNRRKNWDRIQLGNRNLDDLNKRLVGKTTSLSAYISVLGISSQGRVENGVFPELLQKIDHMAAQMRKGNSSIRSVLTTYEGDDKAVWREFRRELIGTGIGSREIHKYSAALKTYLSRLQRDGLLDEEEPPKRDKDSPRVQIPEIQAPHSENDSLLDLSAEKINQSPHQSGTNENKYPADCSDIECDDFGEASPDGLSKQTKDLEAQVTEKGNALGEEHPDTLTLMAKLRLIYWSQGRWKEAEKLELQLFKARKKVLGHKHLDTLLSMYNLTLIFRGQGKYKKAEELGVQVMETQKKVFGHEHPYLLRSMAVLVTIYQHQGKNKEAEKLGVQVLETRKKVLGHEHPDTLISMGNLAFTYWKQNRYKESEKLCTQMIEARKKVLGPKHSETLLSMHNLALVYGSQKRYTEAEELEVQIIETEKTVLGPEHPNTLLSMGNLAFIYWKQGRWKEAEELRVRVIESQKKVLGPEHPDTLRCLADIENILKSPKKSRA